MSNCHLHLLPSRLITIYDVKVELKWSGKAPDGTEANGNLVIPEVSHEVTLDGISEYVVRFPVHPLQMRFSPFAIQFEWSLSTESSKPVDALYELAKQRLRVALEVKFAEFPTVIIETHGRDLTVSTEPSRSGTPVQPTNATSATPNPTTTAPAPKPVAKSSPPKKATVNTATVEVEARFMASADDLFSIFTDEKRIPAWTRAPAKASLFFCAYIHVSDGLLKSDPRPESEYSLFGGGVTGKYLSFDRPKQIVQTWSLRSPGWPTGHDATLTTTLDQSSDSTMVKFTLKGVPSGEADDVKSKFEGY